MNVIKKIFLTISNKDKSNLKDLSKDDDLSLKKKSKIVKRVPEKYITNIKPTSIVLTNLQRNTLNSKIDNNEVIIAKQSDSNKTLVSFNDLENIDNESELMQIQKELSNMRYKIENPVITDMAIGLYTFLTTQNLNNDTIKNIKRTKTNGLRFVIERTDLIKIIMGNSVSNEGFALDGLGQVRKNIMSVLTPLINGKTAVPRQLIYLNNYEMPNGDVKDLILKISPLHFYSSVVDVTTGKEFIEMEMNGILFPIKKVNKLQYRADTSFIHVHSNLSVILSVGEDLYIESREFQQTGKKTKYDVARRFLDFIQLVYSKYSIPETSSVIDKDRLIINVWGLTLRSLLPTAFRTKGGIRRKELVQAANISAQYFFLGIDYLGRRKQIEANDYLVIPDKKCFCSFEPPSEVATFYCRIKS